MRAYMRSAFAAATAAHEGFTNVHKQAFMWNVASALLVLCNGCWHKGMQRTAARQQTAAQKMPGID
jgi:hypothetical protein